MNVLSVCSGIGAPECAWTPLGWNFVACAEIDPFPCHILHHHYGASRPLHMPDPDEAGIKTEEAKRRRAAIKAVQSLPEEGAIPNFGDVNAYKEWPDADIDVLVGGTPCQSFSVAGLRKGLDDPRGNLALVYLAIANRYRPRWLVWENVPGVRSSLSHDAPDPCPPDIDLDGDDGPEDGAEILVEDEYGAIENHAFGCFLAALTELGYGFAYRSPDAQYAGLAQQRERVFAVGYLGDWRRAGAVLFEPESLSGHPAPSREAGQGVAHPIASSAPGGSGYRDDADTADNLIAYGIDSDCLDRSGEGAIGTAGTRAGLGIQTELSSALRSKRPNAVAYGGNKQSMRGVSIIPLDTTQITSAANRSNPQPGDPCHPLAAGAHPPAVAQVADTLTAHWERSKGAKAGNQVGLVNPVIYPAAVRRLMPIECERLQGCPDGYTAITYRGKPAADGPRYKGLGNSMAVPVVRWIGERIDAVDQIPTHPIEPGDAA